MLREWCRSRSPYVEWPALKWLVAGTVAIVYASYWFVIEPPQAHAFYVVAPVAMTFAAYCWTFVDNSRWRRIRGRRAGRESRVPRRDWPWPRRPTSRCIETATPVAAAVRLKQPEMFGHRRSFAVDGGPLLLDDPSQAVRQPARYPVFRREAPDGSVSGRALDAAPDEPQRPRRLPRRAATRPPIATRAGGSSTNATTTSRTSSSPATCATSKSTTGSSALALPRRPLSWPAPKRCFLPSSVPRNHREPLDSLLPQSAGHGGSGRRAVF